MQIRDGGIVEESGAMGWSRVEDGGVSLLCMDRGWQRDRVRGDGVALGPGRRHKPPLHGSGMATRWRVMGCTMESGGVRAEMIPSDSGAMGWNPTRVANSSHRRACSFTPNPS
jgi:hypothetical protein